MITRYGLPTDEELLRDAVKKIERGKLGDLSSWEVAAVLDALEKMIVRYTMKRYSQTEKGK
jgi:hypothetical protein